MIRFRRSAASAGFSLIETIAALGILAMAAVPLLQISTDATRNTGALEARLLARTVGENVMNRALADPLVLEAGLQTGRETQMGRVFTYTLSVGRGEAGGLQTLEVQVTSEREGAGTLARLVSLKAVPLALPAADDPASEADPGANPPPERETTQ